MTTVPPSAARRSTVARPMPLAPPVTIATFPSKRATYISFRRGPQPLAPKTRVRGSNQSAEAPAPWTRLGSEEMGFGAPCRARAPGHPIIEAAPGAYEGRKYRQARESGRSSLLRRQVDHPAHPETVDEAAVQFGPAGLLQGVLHGPTDH